MNNLHWKNLVALSIGFGLLASVAGCGGSNSSGDSSGQAFQSGEAASEAYRNAPPIPKSQNGDDGGRAAAYRNRMNNTQSSGQ